MKAIIMAGGEGVRLRPISSTRPKPMVKLVDKPVLEHVLNLLKRNGIYDVCMTLRFLPQIISEYFGSGTEQGMSIQYQVETEPLGTAGSVKSCSNFLQGDDFLVISGDCVCNFDLTECIRFHQEKKAEVTIVLYKHPEPLEYGLVDLHEDGKIERFIEKPSWEKVHTNLINTGIYIMSANILRDIPEGENFDFGKDLFPLLLQYNRRMYGFAADGYWCDIGTSASYLKCNIDVLEEKVGIHMPEEIQDGIWSQTKINGDVKIIPPVYIGKNTVIEKGATIGPCTIVGSDSYVASGAVLAHTVVDNAVIHTDVTASGAVICKGASIGAGSILNEGAVIGEDTIIGANCLISPKVKIWPSREVKNGAKVMHSLSQGMLREDLTFGAQGVISGEVGITITPEISIALGAACASWGRVGIGWGGGKAARLMASAMGCGVSAAGGDLIEFDSCFEACVSFAGIHFGLPITVFVSQKDDNLSIRFYGENGDKITRDRERKIEAALSGDYPRCNEQNIGSSTQIAGIINTYVASAAHDSRRNKGKDIRFSVSASGNGAENRALKSAFSQSDFTLVVKRQGVPSFEVLDGGLYLKAVDEHGQQIDPEQILVMLALLEFENGTDEIAVSYSAPAILENIAKQFGAKVLRIGRDGKDAEELFSAQTHMHDGVFMAKRLCTRLADTGETLHSLSQRMPKFSSVSRNVLLTKGRAAVMRELAVSCAEMATELVAGLRVDTGRGWVHISPSHDQSALIIRSEGENEEIAEELCVEYENRTRKIDGVE